MSKAIITVSLTYLIVTEFLIGVSLFLPKSALQMLLLPSFPSTISGTHCYTTTPIVFAFLTST